MASCKPLLVYFHAVEIPEIYKEFDKIECDKWDLQYFKYPYPHRIAESIFRKNKQYTHLVLVANDMIPTQEAFEHLMADLLDYDYPVLSGWVNVDQGKYKDHLNVTRELPSLDYSQRRYRWVEKSNAAMNIQTGYPIIKVGFSGFPMMFIKREVLEKTRLNILDPNIPTRGKPYWEQAGGFANDLCFAHNCSYHNIPIYCDLRVRMFHYGLKGKQRVGINQPKVKFIKYNPNVKYVAEIKV